MSGQISIGRSEALRLRPDSGGVDAELARMLARDEEKYHYHLVLLSCTFRTGSAPVVSARLSVALHRDHGDGVTDAVVWSMDPLRASTPVTDRLKLGIDLNGKFVVERTRIQADVGQAQRSSRYPSARPTAASAGERVWLRWTQSRPRDVRAARMALPASGGPPIDPDGRQVGRDSLRRYVRVVRRALSIPAGSYCPMTTTGSDRI